ncbi:uncharacterized protein PRCAT00003061001 [Priceomyces carsonii]|uniref:uncharacterized protein n=1 Tax=Priceomyces carsonii TaxID=28549 RepID=UPI002ED9DA33|nr:unnamed protein product [Priceomyces carsonii]
MSIGDGILNSGRDRLFELTNDSIVTPPRSLDSSESLSAPIIKQRFDDRAQTKLSLILKSQRSHIKSSHISNSSDSLEGPFIRWTDAQLISNIISSPEFLRKYGPCVYIQPSPIHIVIGTERGYVIGFSYHQEIEFVLKSEENGKDSAQERMQLTCLAISGDSSFVAAGYTSGQIVIWDLSSVGSELTNETSHPYFVLKPITIEQRYTEKLQGHLIGIPISSINFLNTLNFQILSTDVSGLVLYSNGFKKFLRKYFVSQKVLGSNDINSKDAKNSIKACELLPLGSSHQITDQICLLAVIKGNTLSIFSLLSLNDPKNLNIVNHFNVRRPKQVSDASKFSVCLNWFPALEKSGRLINARLAYAWLNVLTILEVKNNCLPKNLYSVISELKDKDRAVTKLPILKTCSWVCPPETGIILNVKWLSSYLLCAFVQKDQDMHILILHYSTSDADYSLTLIGEQRLPNINGHQSLLVSGNSSTLNYDNVIKVLKYKIMLMTGMGLDKRISIGRPLNWADRLIHLLSEGDYSGAMITASEYFNSNSQGKNILIGLPEGSHLRRKLMKPYLVQIMSESISHLFADGSSDQQKFLTLYFDITSSLSKEFPSEEYSAIIELLFDAFNDTALFFEILEPYILSGNISVLPPTVLKSLVDSYVEMQGGDILTQMLCILDLGSLDIDFTILLCSKYHLKDCLVYIWNKLLNDYETPLIDFINDSLIDTKIEDCAKMYTYMSFVLTGRQYPTDGFIDFQNEEMGKRSICNVLFSNTVKESSNQGLKSLVGDSIFPYLRHLLKYNSFEMLSTLNEFFEDSFLNDDQILSRQYITEALLDVFEEANFSDDDWCQLAIFIARNYPKYPQFIRLSESVVEKVVGLLCENHDINNKQDRELALQCILPFYDKDNDTPSFLEMLKAAKFYDVLISLYSSEGRRAKAIEIWLEKISSNEHNEDLVESFKSVLSSTFQKPISNIERLSLDSFIKSNFTQMASIDTEVFAHTISEFNPILHEKILDVKEEDVVQNYLKCILNYYDVKPVLDLEPQYPKFICRAITNDPRNVKFLKKFLEFLARDQKELNNVTKVLRKDPHAIEGLYEILIYQLEYEEALKNLIDAIKKMSREVKIASHLKNKIRRLLELAMDDCEEPETYVMTEDEGLSLNESMWLELIRALVTLANSETNDNKEFFNECIHSCFKRISDAKLNLADQKEKSFLTVFNRFLEGSSQSPALLANVRDILQDVFLSYYYESESLDISLKMLDESIYKSMEVVKSDEIRGWDIRNKTCASCEKIIWGSEISDKHYDAWECRRWMLIHNENPLDILNRYHTCSLIFFKCAHGYHLSCLENLGFSKSKSCVLCEAKK